jgi:hypothetical protein
MIRRHFFIAITILALSAALLLFIGANLALTDQAGAAQDETPVAPTPTPHPATAEEFAAAYAEWSGSAHADTFDDGKGANTTCARCKSPSNWDIEAPSTELALDCASCKRVPGEPRPDLEGGIPIEQEAWRNIGCEICHEPSGETFMTSVAYWNNSTQSYEEVDSAQELCAHCHEGRHGFEVIEEQAESAVHNGWECTRCHGPHGAPATCEECHNLLEGAAYQDHLRHQQVNCTACHDAGQLTISLDSDPDSNFYGTFIPIRYAHTLTSWPSHNLQKEVDCTRCHHRPSVQFPAVANQTSCDTSGCHESGAVLHWCPIFKRDPPPGGVPDSPHESAASANYTEAKSP